MKRLTLERFNGKSIVCENPKNGRVKNEGPLLERLMHPLQECPAAFLEEPQIGTTGVVSVVAVVGDLLRALEHDVQSRPNTQQFHAKSTKTHNRLRLILITSWLLHDPWFGEQHDKL